jgi:hypothetical protein
MLWRRHRRTTGRVRIKAPGCLPVPTLCGLRCRQAMCCKGNRFDVLKWHFGQDRLGRLIAHDHVLRLPPTAIASACRPSRSDSSFSPCTIRSPRLTRVSDSNPCRRLLVASKREPGEVLRLGFHGPPPSRRTRGARDFEVRSDRSKSPLWVPISPGGEGRYLPQVARWIVAGS